MESINNSNELILMTCVIIMFIIQLFYNYYFFPKIEKKLKIKEDTIKEHEEKKILLHQEFKEVKKELHRYENDEKLQEIKIENIENLENARMHYKNLKKEFKELEFKHNQLKEYTIVLEEDNKILLDNNNILNEKINEFKKEAFIKNRKERYKKLQQENKKRGEDYEEFVASHFKLDGYKIDLNGIKKGKKDKGIDIICQKDNELILIQCKNWKANSKYKINHEKLKAFVGSCTEYVNENKLHNKTIKLKFISSNNILDKSAENFIKESKTLKYEIIELKS